MMELLQNSTSIWVAFSFAIFIFAAYKFGRASVVGALDNKIERIKADIANAQKLHEDSKALLAEYQDKQKHAHEEAQKIIEAARIHARELEEKADKEFQHTLAHREEMLKEQILRMEEKTRTDLMNYATELAVAAAGHIITQKLDADVAKKLNDASITKTTERLN
jgi:F-type H+-transporting ATPase subunit b